MKNQMTVAGDFGDFFVGDFHIELHSNFQARSSELIMHFESEGGKVRDLTEEEKSEIILETLILAYGQWGSPERFSPEEGEYIPTREWWEIDFHFPGEDTPRRPTEQIEEAQKIVGEYNNRFNLS
jgi:hypothetical protein